MHQRLRRPRTSAERGFVAAATVFLFYALWTPISLVGRGSTGLSYTHLIAPVAIQMFGWAFIVTVVSEILRFVRRGRSL